MPPGRDVVVGAASAGGPRPPRSLLRDLPADLPATGGAVIALNEGPEVRGWSPGAADLWGLRPAGISGVILVIDQRSP